MPPISAFATPIPVQPSPRTCLINERRPQRCKLLRAQAQQGGGTGPSRMAEPFHEVGKRVKRKEKEGVSRSSRQNGFRKKKDQRNSGQATGAAAIEQIKKKRQSRLARRSLIREGVSLRELVLGAEMEGVVQNLVRHGAYVDVGAVTDGLVHVRDMSVDFVHSPRDLVRTGDSVTVWVKYVNPVTNVLGLTMVKPKMGFKDRMKVVEIEIGKRYEGIVERITNYGAYVDIGAERLGFLHVAAVWGRRPRETLEYLRIGQKVWVHVDDVDEIQSHIKLRARGKAGRELTEDGPLGSLAKPEDVVRDDGQVVKSQIVSQRVFLRPGDEELYEGEEEDEDEEGSEEDGEEEDEFDDYELEAQEEVTRPGFLLGDDEIGHMIDDDTEFIGFDDDDEKFADGGWSDFDEIMELRS